MKELSIEEKAKAYDNIIEKANKMHCENCEACQMYIEELIPELKESEDERIRKWLLDFVQGLPDEGLDFHFYNLNKEQVVAWLERQAQKPNPVLGIEIPFGTKDSELQEASYHIPEGFYAEIEGNRVVIKRGEQKPADKVEPKFKIGNWYQCTKDFFGKGVTFDKNTAYYCAKEGCLQDEYGCHIAIVKDLYDNFKLWTIQDAKDGDVLVDEDDNIGICKEIEDNYWDSHIYLGCDGKLRGFSIGGKHEQTDTHPATNKQRDTLMKAIVDAGYTFDFDKKELKMIEQKPAWSDDFEEEMDRYIEENFYGSADNGFFSNRTKRELEVEDVVRIGCHFAAWQKEQSDKELSDKPKQEWSEEDDRHRHRIHTISLIEDLREWANKDGMHSLCLERCAESIDWLKSLKDRVRKCK